MRLEIPGIISKKGMLHLSLIFALLAGMFMGTGKKRDPYIHLADILTEGIVKQFPRSF